MRSTRDYLTDALRRDPDDFAGHAAYADLLAEEGDPRGEYIQLRLALEDTARPAPERLDLEQRSRELRLRHDREWHGELAPFLLDPLGADDDLLAEPEANCSLRFGWIDALHVRCLSVAFARVLAHSPAAALLRRLCLPRTTHHSPREPTATAADRLAPLREATSLGNVRVFQLGDRDREYGWGCQADGTGVADVLRRMPRLEELDLLARPVDTAAVFSVPLPALRVLRVDYGDPYMLATLGENGSLTRMTHLLLSARPDELVPEEPAPPPFDPDGVRALAARHLAGLTHLRLSTPGLGDRGCETLIATGIIARLRELDLRGCGLTGESAHRLAECPDVGRLEKLNVSRNAISEEGIGRLQRLGIAVSADDQFYGPPPELVEEDE